MSSNKRSLERAYKELDRDFISKVGKKNFDELDKLLASGKTNEAKELIEKEFSKMLKDNVANQKAFSDYIVAKSNYAKSLQAQFSGMTDDQVLRLLNNEDLFLKTGTIDPVKSFTSSNPNYGSYALEIDGSPKV